MRRGNRHREKKDRELEEVTDKRKMDREWEERTNRKKDRECEEVTEKQKDGQRMKRGKRHTEIWKVNEKR